MRLQSFRLSMRLVALLVCLIAANLSAITAELQVLSPPNYSYILKGMTITLKWTTSEPADKVQLWYWYHHDDMTGEGSLWTWLPPSGGTLQTTDTYIWDFKVSGYVAEAYYDFHVKATKGAQVVEAGVITVYFMWNMIAPTYCYPGADTLFSGQKYKINWNWAPCIEFYEVQESTSWNYSVLDTSYLIPGNAAELSQETSHVVDSLQTHYHRVRGVNYTCGNQSNWTSSGKAIIIPPFEIIDPEPPPASWNAGELHAITWETMGDLSGNVIIQLFKGGKLHSSIAPSTANTGQYDWTIPAGTPGASDYRIKIASENDTAIYSFNKNDFTIGQFNGVEEPPADRGLPLSYRLERNFPNPFNSATTLRYDIPESSEIQIMVYDVTGKKIRSLAHGFRIAGKYAIRWNGESDLGQKMPSGLYVVTMKAAGFNQRIKILMIQ